MQIQLTTCDACKRSADLNSQPDAADWVRFELSTTSLAPNGPATSFLNADLCPACNLKMNAAISGILIPFSPSPGAQLWSLDDVERNHILDVLKQLSWNKQQSAKVLGIERSTLDRKLKLYGAVRPTPQQRCPIHFASENAAVPTSNAFCTCANHQPTVEHARGQAPALA